MQAASALSVSALFAAHPTPMLVASLITMGDGTCQTGWPTRGLCRACHLVVKLQHVRKVIVVTQARRRHPTCAVCMHMRTPTGTPRSARGSATQQGTSTWARGAAAVRLRIHIRPQATAAPVPPVPLQATGGVHAGAPCICRHVSVAWPPSATGRQHSADCWCGDTYGSQGDSDACGDQGELCGNGITNCGNANAIFELQAIHEDEDSSAAEGAEGTDGADDRMHMLLASRLSSANPTSWESSFVVPLVAGRRYQLTAMHVALCDYRFPVQGQLGQRRVLRVVTVSSGWERGAASSLCIVPDVDV